MKSEPGPGIGGIPSARGPVPWGSRDISLAILLVVAGFLLFMATGHVLVSTTTINVAAATLLTSVGLQAILAGTAFAFSVRKYRAPLRALGFRTVSSIGPLWYTGVAIFGSVVVVALYGAGISASGLEAHLPPPPFLLEKNELLVAAGVAIAALAAPLTEEIFFRGFVFGGLRTSVGPWAAGAMSAALFAVAHMNVFLYLPVFVIGLLLAWVYHQSGSLWFSVLAHTSYNALVAYWTLSQQ